MNIDVNTSLLGLIGNPLKHSLSPFMHNLTLQKMGLNYVYLPFETHEDRLEDAVAAISGLNIRGVNVTIPFKEEVIKYLDDLSEEALACRAVNLIENTEGRLVGYNTDGRGFVAALREEGVAIAGRVLLIGAGGAARSIAYQLAREGAAQIDFLDINYHRAAGLAEFIRVNTLCPASAELMGADSFASLGSRADIIVNCSPVGMYPHIEETAVSDISPLRMQTVLCDVIYNPLTTKFLRIGQAKGLKTINGLPMFVHQGALSLEILLGVKPPLDYMKEVVHHQFK